MTARLLCIGDLNLDLTILPGAPVAAGSDTSGVVRLDGGGSAANVAAGAAATGVPTRFVGVVGDDLLGSFLVGELAGHGVDVIPVVRTGTSSRSIAVIVGPDGDRSMVSDLGTTVALGVGDVDPAWFTDVSWLHLTAYTWFAAHSAGVWDMLRQLAAEHDVAVSIDPSSAQMLTERSTPADARRAFSGATLLTPSLDEAAWLSGHADPGAAAIDLLDVAHVVAVTTGADGAWVADRVTPSSRHIAVEPIDVVSTLGCGDAFAAGMIGALLDDQSPDDAAAAGVAAGRLAAGRRSAR